MNSAFGSRRRLVALAFAAPLLAAACGGGQAPTAGASKAPAAQSSGAPAYPPPSALLNTLAGQLDLREVDIDDALVVYENEAWVPARATLTAAAAAASQEAGFESLVRTDRRR